MRLVYVRVLGGVRCGLAHSRACTWSPACGPSPGRALTGIHLPDRSVSAVRATDGELRYVRALDTSCETLSPRSVRSVPRLVRDRVNAADLCAARDVGLLPLRVRAGGPAAARRAGHQRRPRQPARHRPRGRGRLRRSAVPVPGPTDRARAPRSGSAGRHRLSSSGCCAVRPPAAADDRRRGRRLDVWLADGQRRERGPHRLPRPAAPAAISEANAAAACTGLAGTARGRRLGRDRPRLATGADRRGSR